MPENQAISSNDWWTALFVCVILLQLTRNNLDYADVPVLQRENGAAE